MKSNTGRNIAILAVLIVGFGLATIRMFGQTVSAKYQTASSGVASEVTFGGDYVPRPSTQSAYREVQPPPRRHALTPAAPAPTVTVAAHDRMSTFALDVDTASYTYARATINAGGYPYGSEIRPEEFVNYFDYSHKAPRAETPFGVRMETAPSPTRHGREHQILRLQIDARKVAQANRKPANLTFLVDTSGSMAAPNKLPLAVEALKYLTRQLDGRDTIAIVTYAGDSRRVLAPTPATEIDHIYEALDGMQAGGGTAMSNGMELAYQAALEGYKRGHVNRVIVVSDGDANIGASSHQAILANIRSRVDDGIHMTTIGVGMGNHRNELMEQLADNGNGNAFYVDGLREAKRIFGQKLTGTLEVVAKEAKVQVEFDPARVRNYRLIGYENRAIADHDFRNDSVDAGEIGAGHQVTAIYEVELNDDDVEPYAVAHIRWMEPEEFTAREGHYAMKSADIHDDLDETSPDHQFAVGVALFAEKLRSTETTSATWAIIEDLMKAGVTPARPERREAVELMRMVSGRS